MKVYLLKEKGHPDYRGGLLNLLVLRFYVIILEEALTNSV